MGDRETSNTVGVIAAVLVVGFLLLLGCAGVAAVGLFMARTAPIQGVAELPRSVDPKPIPSQRWISNNPDGQAVMGGGAFNGTWYGDDDELREKLAEEAAAGFPTADIVQEFTADITPERRAEIQQILAEAAVSESTTSTENVP